MKTIIAFLIALALTALPLTAQTNPPAPSDVSADAFSGKTVTLSVTAQGTQPFTYQWEKSTGGTAPFAAIAGATSDKLVLTNVTPANVGVYRVRISNAAGSITSPTATLRVIVGPTIEAYTITVTGE